MILKWTTKALMMTWQQVHKLIKTGIRGRRSVRFNRSLRCPRMPQRYICTYMVCNSKSIIDRWMICACLVIIWNSRKLNPDSTNNTISFHTRYWQPGHLNVGSLWKNINDMQWSCFFLFDHIFRILNTISDQERGEKKSWHDNPNTSHLGSLWTRLWWGY